MRHSAARSTASAFRSLRISARALTDSRSEIDLQLHTIGVEPPVSQMAAAFKPTFGRLDGAVDAFGAADHDALLEASELVPVGAEQVFEKAHSISAHDLLCRPAAG
jgi:hypothetical protein